MEEDPQDSRIRYGDWTTASPVSCSGYVGDRRFYFYARYNYWRFVISEDFDVSPLELAGLADSDLEATQRSEQPFPSRWIEAFRNCFYRTQDYGAQKYDASNLPIEEAKSIIRKCAEEYLTLKKENRA